MIQDRILEPGDMAFPETPVFTLALTNPVWVRAYISEPDLGKVAPGMKAYLTTDSFPDKKYEGWIGFISPTAEFTPKQVQTTELRTKLVYRLRIYACNPKNELRLGMPVTVMIPLNQPREKIAAGTAARARKVRMPAPEETSVPAENAVVLENVSKRFHPGGRVVKALGFAHRQCPGRHGHRVSWVRTGAEKRPFFV